ncbi:translocase ULS1 [Sugiyamaella lignohabitans]|uniref:Translocase ULS1 n=1 Tax=Sugiyamaella lignohabitans TaxID=796027 RepID=A0A167DVF3_9ASCO|nr:translocase ULS1 [Sugiyamaella lignohabitans]ANB13340.1 translocase ULS1 [Sugiyamaella lignohabitans]
MYRSLIVSRKSNNPQVKTTLIVAPLSLLRQWERELTVRVRPEHRMKIYIHHSSSTSKLHKTAKEFKEYDVVLTTYNMIGREYKKHFNVDTNGEPVSRVSSPFFEVEWYRIVCDEAQYIKNKTAVSSKGCAALTGDRRWCLSGTPIQNRIEELYSLIKFLKIEPYCNERKFSQEIARGLSKSDRASGRSLTKLRALLKAIMLRRTKDSKIDGKPILNLPPKTIEFAEKLFDEEEDKAYKSLEAKGQEQMNKYLEAGTVEKNYTNILTILLRLRQACCHPKLIEKSKLKQMGDSSKGRQKVEVLERVRDMDSKTVQRIKNVEDFSCPICYDATDTSDLVLLTPCGHHLCAECSPKFFSLKKDPSLGPQGARCSECRGPVYADKTVSYETFDLVHNQGLSDSEIVEVWKLERKHLLNEIKMRRDAVKRRKLEARELDLKMFDSDGEDEGEDKKPDVVSYDVNEVVDELGLAPLFRQGWISSTKIDSCMNQIHEIRRDFPSEKIIVFSQFTSMLDFMEVPLISQGIAFIRYDGSMSGNERNDAIKDFFEQPDMSIMLISLKAGNVGLTLTCASHVIILDPFWNPFVEEQAMDRAHRIGQPLPVHVHRIVIKNTVEDRILELQKKKKNLVGAAMDETGLKKISKLNRSELKFLFGLGGNINQMVDEGEPASSSTVVELDDDDD